MVWGAVVLGVTIRVILIGDDTKGVYDVFRTAGQLWVAGADTYDPQIRYRYPPVATAFFAGIHTPGVVLGSLLWRWLNIAAYLGAVAWAMRVGFPARLGPRSQGMVWLLMVPPSMQSLRNGQANGLLAGALLTAAILFARSAMVRAGLLSAVAVACKVFPIAFGMCFALLSPGRYLPALLLGVAVAAALPFAVAPADYVQEQYRSLVALLGAEDRTVDPDDAYRDLRLMLLHLGMPISTHAYTVIQMLGGGAIAAMGLLGHHGGWSPARTAAFLLTTTCCWMLVLGFSAEQATYILTTPMLCWGVLYAHESGHRRLFWGLVAGYACYLFPLLAGPFRRGPLARSILPASTLALGAWLWWVAFRDVQHRLWASRSNPSANPT